MNRQKLAVCAVYLLGFGFGLTITMLAPAMDSITAGYGITMAQGGLTNTLLNVGGLLGVLVSLFFSDRFSKVRLYSAAYLTFCAALILSFSAGKYPILLLLLVFLGLGGKIVDTLSNPIVSACVPGETSRYLNLLHTFIGVGACASPVLTQLLLDWGLSWKLAFTLVGVLCLVFFLGGRFMLPRSEAARTTALQDDGRPLPLAAILAVCLCVFFYTGHQVIVNTWAPLYMQTTLGSSGLTASLSTTILWVGIIAGRLVCARFSRTEHALFIAVWGNAAGAVLLTAAVLTSSGALVLLGILLTGIVTGAVIPMCIDLLSSRCPRIAGRITACVFLSIVVSSMLYPVAAGALADHFGFTAAMLLSALSLLPAALSALAARPMFSKQ